MGKQRALIVIRLSRVTDATTSPERQLEACRELCKTRGYDIVGEATDLDVSAGATTPFERPQLGPWLNDRHHDFDVLVVYRMDRLVRRLLDLADVIRWGEAHDVALVSATEAFLDLTAPFGDVVAMLVAKVAEMELDAISARNASAATHNIRHGKWRGGIPPWGYTPQQDDSGDWRLVPDPEQVPIIQEVARAVLDGTPLRAIAHDLTGRGVLTPKDRFAQLKGRKVVGYEWHSGPLKRSLTSRTLLGQVVTRDPVLDSKGQIQRDHRGHRVLGQEFVVPGPDGSPLVRATPILDRSTFDRVGKALEGRENRKEPDVRTSSLLLRVLYCGVCGRPAYRFKGAVGRNPRYRCASTQYRDKCSNATIALAEAEAQAEAKVLAVVGPMERTTRVWEPGSDVSRELAEVGEELLDLTEQLGTAAFRRGTPQRERLDTRLNVLAQRQAELEQVPSVPAGWRYVGTGQTIAQWWEGAELEVRNRWLRETGVTVTWRSHIVNSRTVVDALDVNMGDGPAFDGVSLPGPIAGAASLARSFRGAGDEAVAGVLEHMGRGYWRDGDALSEMTNG